MIRNDEVDRAVDQFVAAGELAKEALGPLGR
jgi:hypothetical protein